MKRFKIGDKVRVIDDDRYIFTTMYNHTEGIIRDYDTIHNDYVIEITECDDTDFIGNKYDFSDNEIELIPNVTVTIDKDGMHINKIGEQTVCSVHNSLTSLDTKLELEGENKMNKVLNLYYENHLKEICNKYDKLIDKDYSEISIIKEYNVLIENFEKQLDDLFTKSEIEEVPFEEVTSYNVYKFEPDNDEIKADLFEKYKNAENNEIDELTKLKNEVEAQLSLSDDVDYQLDVLKRYDIINKKTGRIN